jgi:hypothetical protein
MPLSYRELSQPIVEPVLLAQAKQQLVVGAGFTDDDALISALITASRQYVEKLMNRCIYNRSMQLTLDYFPYPNFGTTINPNDRHVLFGTFWHALAIKLPKPGCVSVQSVTYVDLSGIEQTLPAANYFTDVNSEPARIVPIPGTWWPYTQNYLPGSVCVTYNAGTYGDGVTVDTCPQTIKQAMLLLISYWYNHRDSAETTPPKAIEMGVDALLAGEKFETFGWE